MRIRVTDKDLSQQKVDLAVCFAYEGDAEPCGVRDRDLRRELAAQMRAERFEGNVGDRLVWNADGRYKARRFLVLGLGPRREVPGEAVRRGAARAARAAAGFGSKSLGLCLPDGAPGSTAQEARAAIEGAMLGAYRYERYLTDPKRRKVALSSIELAATGKAELRRAVTTAEIASRAVCLARDLVNEGPSRLTPAAMARIAAREARAAGLACKVLGPAELERTGMHALLSVARGSAEPPRVVHLTYRPSRAKARERIVLIGKGVTFDSGGLNLKPGDFMRHMKCDMAGAAAVLATMTTLRALGCKAEVHGLLGLTENMPGAAGYKPGDILDTFSGKTVEVGNTDAEGRLVMCDLLAWAAAKLKPTKMADVATLTGACVVALGTMATGVFSRHDALREAVLAAGRAAGEKLWPLPMYDEYLAWMQRGPADLCNVAGRWGGAITAALFLGEFVPRELPWIHLDIAGPAFNETESPDTPLGGTGAGVPTLVRWLEQS